jgi:hypothetical protein
MALRTLLAREPREIRTKLAVDDAAAFGLRLSEALDERDRHDAEVAAAKKEAAEAAAAARSVITARIDEARDAIRSGSRREQVQVEDWAEHESGIVSTIRTDTSEVIGQRPMTEKEKQVPIDFVGPPPTAPKEGEEKP